MDRKHGEPHSRLGGPFLIEVDSLGNRIRPAQGNEAGWLRLAPGTARPLLQRLSYAFTRKVPGKRPMTWETALLRGAQRFAEDISIERRTPRWFDFDLPLPGVHPPTLGPAVLAAKIGRMSVPETRRLMSPKTTQWYQQKRLRTGAPLRVYRKVIRRLSRAVAPESVVQDGQNG